MDAFQSSTRLTALLFLAASLGCQHQAEKGIPATPPTQRLVAKTALSVSMYSWQKSVDTVRVAGFSYPVYARDSVHYTYDAFQRLIHKELTQAFVAPGTLYPPTSRNEYSYQAGQLIERAGIGPQGEGMLFKYPLDSSGHRVSAYTRKEYSSVNFDSLRVYSAQGMLTSAVQLNYNATYPPANKHTPNLKVFLESGNITRVESYAESGKLYRIARYVYDNKHYAPLATDTFLGETSRNALLRLTILTYASNETVTSDFTYSNEYDSQGRLRSQVQTELPSRSSPLGNQILTKFYY